MAKKKTATSAEAETQAVETYIKELVHPLKAEIEAVRKIIRQANKKISERVKWNAPSYYYKEDLVTFNPRDLRRVHLVFHHKTIVDIASPLLEGTYKDRRMTYFSSMKEVEAHRVELARIINALISSVDGHLS